MLDLNLFRKETGNKPELIRQSQRRRFANVEVVDEVIELDREFVKLHFELDRMIRNFSHVNKLLAAELQLDLQAGPSSSRDIQQHIVDKKVEEIEAARAAVYSKLKLVGNFVHDSVPVSNDEANNAVIRTWGEKRTAPNLKNHLELLELLGIADFKRGAKIAGEGSFSFTGRGVDLEQALINFGIGFLERKGSAELRPISSLKEAMMGNGVDKVTGEEDDKHLIAAAGLPICNTHDCIHPTQLPLRYVGQSTGLSEQTGSCGRPQYKKVEQLGITSPNGNDSWDMHEEMIKNTEEFYQMLNLPYQVVSIVSGSLHAAAAKTYDLEAWFPASATYRKLLSCSNYTDYHSREVDVRFGVNQRAMQFCHLLDSTLTPTQTTICCILENHQREDGVEVPLVLQSFMQGKEFMPFQAPPVNETKENLSYVVSFEKPN